MYESGNENVNQLVVLILNQKSNKNVQPQTAPDNYLSNASS